MNHYIIDQMLREKREDMLREAEHQRLLAQYSASVGQVPNRFLVCVGDWLICLGERLKGHRVQKAGVPTS